uniref:Uncharacterized protein n=1 Tax=Nigrospora oryzae unassigned RNA virus 1 TaxID=1762895 RepID=A0A0U2L491_9VIRU|nr:hypothetical protein [Nigrospora oryzae unassigned RNA virus 1]
MTALAALPLTIRTTTCPARHTYSGQHVTTTVYVTRLGTMSSSRRIIVTSVWNSLNGLFVNASVTRNAIAKIRPPMPFRWRRPRLASGCSSPWPSRVIIILTSLLSRVTIDAGRRLVQWCPNNTGVGTRVHPYLSAALMMRHNLPSSGPSSGTPRTTYRSLPHRDLYQSPKCAP